jgi:hypothetical protein
VPGVVGLVIGPLFLRCSLEFVDSFEDWMEARRSAGADLLARVVDCLIAGRRAACLS